MAHQGTCGHTSVCMCMLGQRGVQGSCVSQDVLEPLLLPDVCGVSRVLEEGVKHREHEEECILMKIRAKKAWNEVPCGIVWFQVGAGFSLESDPEFLFALLEGKLIFDDDPFFQEEVTVSEQFEGVL